MKRQRGVTLTGLIIGAFIGIVVLLLGFKVVPVYVEYFAIEKQLKAMAADPKLRGATRSQVAAAWAARAAVDNLTSVHPDYIEVERLGDDVVYSAEYAVKVPLVRNVAACFDFRASSQ